MHVLKEILGDSYPPAGNLMRPGPKPKFTDVEVIALSLTAECLGIDSELYLFVKLETDYKKDFPNLISRRQYNDRRKSLFPWQTVIREKIVAKLNELCNLFAIDSMPLEVCKPARMLRNKLGKESEYGEPDRGFSAVQNKYYYGYKLHCVCSPGGVIETCELSKASVHDVHYLKDVGNTYKDCTIIGDRGYINKILHHELKKKSNINMAVQKRNNQKNEKPLFYIHKRIRKRIETVFSQLCDQFMIQRNYAKTYRGYRTRILAKVSGMAILQFLNKFIHKRPIGQVKYALR